MPIFINKASVNTGQVRANTTVPANERNTALQACRYNSNSELIVSTGTPITSDQYTQGARFDANGAIFIHPVETQGTPANISFDGGLPFSLEGKLITTTAVAVQYTNGWPLDQRGFVCMAVGV